MPRFKLSSSKKSPGGARAHSNNLGLTQASLKWGPVPDGPSFSQSVLDCLSID
jgi:hypothetical protein